jgi:hypothetical protein
MDKISGDKVFSIHPLPDGFLYAYCIEQTEEHYKVGYKMVSFETGKVSSVTKSIYMLTKFGVDYKTELYFEFDEPARDYLFINKYEIAVLESGIYLL